MRPVDVTPADLETVRNILREHAPGLEARAFGSRVSWTARETSDLDLALMTPEPLDATRMAALRAAFTDSDLPFRVDIVDWAGVSGNFRQAVEKDCVALAKANANDDMERAWPSAALKDLIDLRISSVDKKINPSEDAVLLCNYMDVYRNSFIHSRLDFMNGSATKREVAKYSLRAGDVIITKDSEQHDDIGVPALVREDVPNLLCGYHLAILRPASPLIDGTYLFYALSAFESQKQFHSYANGITRFGLRKADIGLVEIPLPPLSEQRAIAGALRALDDKIELNRRANETLEAMVHAVFNDWFVNFGPIRAKMEGCEPYLAPELRSLFPDRIDGTTGLPEGWTHACLGDIAAPRNRAVDPAEVAGDTPYIGLKHMPRRSITLDRWESASRITSQKRRFEKGEFLFGKLAPHFHKVGIAPCNGICSTDILVIRAISEEWSAFVLPCISAGRFIDFAARTATGTTMPRTNWNALSQYQFAMPPTALATAYHNAVSPMLERIVASVEESRMLADIRDALLPKIISGEVRIDVAARQLESAA